jgi:hypothetical protein
VSVRLADLKPGDVLLTFSEGWGSFLIRLGAFLQRKSSLHNHIALYTHTDAATGIPWGLEGRPGGFGWRDLRGYLTAPATISNAWQPDRSDPDRAALVERMKTLIGVAYDWQAIAVMGAEVFDHRATDLIEPGLDWPDGHPPPFVVCSSAIDWGYEDRGWTNPGGLERTRWTTPADFTQLIVSHRWHVAPG